MQSFVSTASVALLLSVSSAAGQSNIAQVHKYAWGENIGWTNWRDANDALDGVVVGEEFLSGYIWCENVGWVNVGNGNGPYGNNDDTDFGVNIEPSGDLNGYAWGENIGWVNFDTSSVAPDQARYDFDAGRFRGYAWGENVGWINLDDEVHYVATCRASSQPEPDPAPDPSDSGFGTKNRYLTFVAGDAGQSQAVQVTFTSLPFYLGPEPPENYDFRYANGRTAWVQEPYLVTEASGSSDPVPPPTMWAAVLDCTPFYTDWSVYGTVHVFDDGIVWDGTYDIRVLDSTCDMANPADYSEPLTVPLSRSGDIVGDCGVRPCTAPQGVVDFVDISACVEKFKNEPGAPRKARTDIINSDIAAPKPDQKVDFVDISCVVEAFRGSECVLPGPPPTDPCP